jgi:hypothetical protein
VLGLISMSHQAIKKSIRNYAKAYSELQFWQDNHNAIPSGDQKTGSIGEYYSFLYLSHIYPVSILTYGGHSQKGWDINVDLNGEPIKIQVKTVSEYSKTRTISPIHKGWDFLYLICLDLDLYPSGFWIIEDKSIFGGQDILKSRKCPIPGSSRTGSKDIPFGKNIVDDMKEAIEKAV